MTPPLPINSTQYTQPPECAATRNTLPALPSNIEFYNQVPLYQDHDKRDMKEVLQNCCGSSVWVSEDPDPCTVVCHSGSSKEAKRVMYCLNKEGIVYGSQTEKVSAAGRVKVRGSLWGIGLVGLVVFGMIL
ncbi:hypothetical protein N7461_003671 [Penicillium sp. DV-2018c]|nr:hypothetical protein N7461_003671 [Penicillium sp. DV-2018c]